MGVDVSNASSTRSEAPKGKALTPGDPAVWEDYAPTKEDGGFFRAFAEPSRARSNI